MNNERKTRKFHEFATEEDKELWKIAQEWDISDEELFEAEQETEEVMNLYGNRLNMKRNSSSGEELKCKALKRLNRTSDSD